MLNAEITDFIYRFYVNFIRKLWVKFFLRRRFFRLQKRFSIINRNIILAMAYYWDYVLKRSTLKMIISISARLGSLKIDESCTDKIYTKQRVVKTSKKLLGSETTLQVSSDTASNADKSVGRTQETPLLRRRCRQKYQ